MFERLLCLPEGGRDGWEFIANKFRSFEAYMQYRPIFGSGEVRGKARGCALDCITNSAARGVVVKNLNTISKNMPNVLQSHQSYQSGA